MPIIVTAKSEYTQSDLNSSDIQSLFTALSSVVELPNEATWSNVQNVNINISSDAAGYIGISVLKN
jgi:hypothetical protein